MNDPKSHSALPAELAAAKNIDDVREWFLGISRQIGEERTRFIRSVVWVAVAGLSLAYVGYWLNHRAMTNRMAAMQTELNQKKEELDKHSFKIDQQISDLDAGLKEADLKRTALEKQSKELAIKQEALTNLIISGEETVKNLKTVDEKVNKLLTDTKAALGMLVSDAQTASQVATKASTEATNKLATLSATIKESQDARKKAEEAAKEAAKTVETTQVDIKAINEDFRNLAYQLINSTVSKDKGEFVWKGNNPFSPAPKDWKRPDPTPGHTP